MLSLFILIPLAGVILLNLPFGPAFRRCAFPVAVLLAVAQIVIALLAPAGWAAPGQLDSFLKLNLAATDLSRVLLLATGLVLFTTFLVGWNMMQEARARFNFINVLLLALIGMNGVVLVTDLFSLYVFIEVTAIASFVLIAFDRRKHALEGAFKYIVLSAVATILMIGSVALLLLVAGGTSFASVAAALKAAGASPIPILAVGGFLCGLFIKGGIVPFHGWLPDAYSAAPAPVSIFLAGIATKVSGIYALIRLTADTGAGAGLTGVFPPSYAFTQVILLVGAVSIVVGALAAIVQTDLKRMLAYSSISQVGYIVIGLGAGPLGVAGSVFHLFNHALFKSLLFVNSAAVEQRLGTTDMNRLRGLGSRMPVTGVTSLIASLSTAGIPPLSGFWSKLIIIIALWQTGHHVYAGIAVLFSVVTLGYFLLMQRRLFFGKVADEFAHVREAGFGIVVPAVLLAFLTIAVGLAFPWILNTFVLPIAGL